MRPVPYTTPDIADSITTAEDYTLWAGRRNCFRPPISYGAPSVTPAKAGVQESRGVAGLGTPNATRRVWEPFPPSRE